MNASHGSRFILRSLPGSDPDHRSDAFDQIPCIFRNIGVSALPCFPNYPGIFLQQRKVPTASMRWKSTSCTPWRSRKPLQRRQPRAAVRIPEGSAEKRCAAQAEYLRLAAQAYSPSDAMSQARLCLEGMKKVQRSEVTNSRVETGFCGGRIWSRGWGGSSRFPRHRRPRRVAPCGGVVSPSRRGVPARKSCVAPGLASIPDGSGRAAAAADAVSTALQAGQAAAAGRVPARG